MPIKVLYPLDYLPTPNPAQTSLIDKFVEGLESALHVTRTEISLAECWKRDCPDGPEHTDIAEYLRLVCFELARHAIPLLSLRRLEAILITEIHTTIWLASEMSIRRNMGNRLSSRRPCDGNGKADPNCIMVLKTC